MDQTIKTKSKISCNYYPLCFETLLQIPQFEIRMHFNYLSVAATEILLQTN